jgi:hypothetical protein
MLDRQSCKCIKILTKGDQRSISGLSALKSEPTIRYFPDFGRSRHWPGGFQGSLCPANYEFTCAKNSRSQRKSGLTGCSAEWPTTGERQDWAVRVIRHQGLIVTDAAPCTFLNEGRKPELRCKRSERQQESDVAKSRLDCHNRRTPSARAKP